MQVTILGAGNMGTALAKVIAGNGHAVKIWNVENDPAPLEQIKKYHENKKYLAGIKLPANIKAESDLQKAITGAKVLITAIPSQFIVGIVKRAAPYIVGKIICLDASKGLTENLEIIPQIIKKNLPPLSRPYIGSLSGPAVATDLAKGGFTAMDIAAQSQSTIKIARQILENKHLKLTATTDLVGVELAGSFKNVYAIALGMATGLNYSLNTLSALIVAALKEMAGLVKAAGGKEETVFGLSGVGDLIGTGLCPTSRNQRFGACLAHGMCTREAIDEVKQVVEGVPAAAVIQKLGKKYAVKLPLATIVARCVKGANVKKEMEKYLKFYC